MFSSDACMYVCMCLCVLYKKIQSPHQSRSNLRAWLLCRGRLLKKYICTIALWDTRGERTSCWYFQLSLPAKRNSWSGLGGWAHSEKQLKSDSIAGQTFKEMTSGSSGIILYSAFWESNANRCYVCELCAYVWCTLCSLINVALKNMDEGLGIFKKKKKKKRWNST